jgi:hypothetical protein
LLVNTLLGDNTISLMKYIQGNFPQIKRIEWLNELRGIGAGGANRIMVGKFDNERLCGRRVRGRRMFVKYNPKNFHVKAIPLANDSVILRPDANELTEQE